MNNHASEGLSTRVAVTFESFSHLVVEELKSSEVTFWKGRVVKSQSGGAEGSKEYSYKELLETFESFKKQGEDGRPAFNALEEVRKKLQVFGNSKEDAHPYLTKLKEAFHKAVAYCKGEYRREEELLKTIAEPLEPEEVQEELTDLPADAADSEPSSEMEEGSQNVPNSVQVSHYELDEAEQSQEAVELSQEIEELQEVQGEESTQEAVSAMPRPSKRMLLAGAAALMTLLGARFFLTSNEVVPCNPPASLDPSLHHTYCQLSAVKDSRNVLASFETHVQQLTKQLDTLKLHTTQLETEHAISTNRLKNWEIGKLGFRDPQVIEDVEKWLSCPFGQESCDQHETVLDIAAKIAQDPQADQKNIELVERAISKLIVNTTPKIQAKALEAFFWLHQRANYVNPQFTVDKVLPDPYKVHGENLEQLERILMSGKMQIVSVRQFILNGNTESILLPHEREKIEDDQERSFGSAESTILPSLEQVEQFAAFFDRLLKHQIELGERGSALQIAASLAKSPSTFPRSIQILNNVLGDEVVVEGDTDVAAVAKMLKDLPSLPTQDGALKNTFALLRQLKAYNHLLDIANTWKTSPSEELRALSIELIRSMVTKEVVGGMNPQQQRAVVEFIDSFVRKADLTEKELVSLTGLVKTFRGLSSTVYTEASYAFSQEEIAKFIEENTPEKCQKFYAFLKEATAGKYEQLKTFAETLLKKETPTFAGKYLPRGGMLTKSYSSEADLAKHFLALDVYHYLATELNLKEPGEAAFVSVLTPIIQDNLKIEKHISKSIDLMLALFDQGVSIPQPIETEAVRLLNVNNLAEWQTHYESYYASAGLKKEIMDGKVVGDYGKLMHFLQKRGHSLDLRLLKEVLESGLVQDFVPFLNIAETSLRRKITDFPLLFLQVVQSKVSAVGCLTVFNSLLKVKGGGIKKEVITALSQYLDKYLGLKKLTQEQIEALRSLLKTIQKESGYAWEDTPLTQVLNKLKTAAPDLEKDITNLQSALAQAKSAKKE